MVVMSFPFGCLARSEKRADGGDPKSPDTEARPTPPLPRRKGAGLFRNVGGRDVPVATTASPFARVVDRAPAGGELAEGVERLLAQQAVADGDAAPAELVGPGGM